MREGQSRPLAGVKQTSARKSRCVFEGGRGGRRTEGAWEEKNRTTVYISGTRAWTYGRGKAREKARWDDAYYRVNNVYIRRTAVDEINGLTDKCTSSFSSFFFLINTSSFETDISKQFNQFVIARFNN